MFRTLHRRRNEKGFTLIEMLIVVVIVAILAAISVPIYVEYVKTARASDAKTTISGVWQAAQVFYQDKGEWPATVEELSRRATWKWLSPPGCSGPSASWVRRR